MGSNESAEEHYAVSTPANGYYGDAVYETSNGASSNSKTSWYSDVSGFPHLNVPFFQRGGWSRETSGAGIFHFSGLDNNINTAYSFRLVISVLQ